MKKDAYYFSHDSNASSDPKCSALIHDFGMAGYGLYWAIIEILHQQKGGKLEKFPKLFDGLAHQLMVQKEQLMKQIEAMLHEYFLLHEDEKYIWSDRVLRNLDEKEEKRQIKVEAGRIGGIKSGLSRNYNKHPKHNEAELKANEAVVKKMKQSKVKESKRKENSNTVFSGEKKDKYIRDENGEIMLDHNGNPQKSLKGMVY